ncbi:ABC transporter permease subunit [Heyndrickxia sporothermodurans]|uniref:ABC transporter permease subunit n=1 Tax=Heyndrickxia vini TaxID=1476025 RepID=A0ABX7E347_9BACI|nr:MULTISPECIES: ABC transporter permease subunit [Heyndrickxia]MEB6550954.1 ABC transporter permease subunit [Heyndrickxia sporothermodurans]QQZ09733.1 ABC transporter permease subunit [Heyndrickxia vini]
MSAALFKTMLKMNGKSISSYAFGAAFYMLLIIWIYPSIAKSDALEQLFKEMPQNYLSAFGFDGGMINDLSGFLAAEYYGLLYLIILMIFSVVTATQLIARLVDRGSMAYLLSTPASRVRIAITQSTILVLGLLVITIFSILPVFIGTKWIIEDANINSWRFIEMNIVGFLLFFVISGYSFLFSCMFNDEKKALAVSGGLSIIFFAINLVAKMSTDFEWLKHVTIFSAFQPTEIAKGSVDILPVSLALGGAGIVLYVLAVIIFKKRDLPL